MSCRCDFGHDARARFFFAGERKCVRHALVHRPLLRTSLTTALVVGTILTAINQGNVLLAGKFPAELWWKIPLTYCVPFLVASWAALRISFMRSSHATGGE